MTERVKLKDFKGGLFAGGKKGSQPLEPKEQPISKSIEDFLGARHLYNDRLNSGNVCIVKEFPTKGGKMVQHKHWMRLCKKGTPDRFFIHNGKIYFVEVKMRGQKATPEQLALHAELIDSGAIVIVADSLEDFIEQFNILIPEKAVPLVKRG